MPFLAAAIPAGIASGSAAAAGGAAAATTATAAGATVAGASAAAAGGIGAGISAGLSAAGTAAYGSLFGTATGALSNIASGISIGSTLLSGQQQAQAAKITASKYTAAAGIDAGNAGQEVAKNEANAARIAAVARANSGGSGITTAGSPTQAVNETTNQANAADVYQRYTGKVASENDLYEASLQRYNAQQDVSGSYLKAGFQAVTSGQQNNSLLYGGNGYGSGFIPGQF